MADTTAWLIERADPQRPSQPLPNNFLGIAGTYDGHYGAGQLQWMSGVDNAIRFSRQEDAAKFVGMLMLLQDGMPLRETIRGLRTGEPRALVVEHMWSMQPDHTPQPPSAPEQWRDISTAPKDGAWFLGRESRIGMNTRYAPEEVMRWHEKRGQWINSADRSVVPDHWQPLPAPPLTHPQKDGA